jgi:hypothetical protein
MQHRFLQHFVVPVVAMFLRWTPVKLHMKQFRMADDVQAKQLLMQLKTMGDLSAKSLLGEFDKDYEDEQALIVLELRKKLELQTMQVKAQGSAQAEAQEMVAAKQAAAAQPAGAAATEERPVNVLQLAQGWAYRLAQMDPAQRAEILAQMRARMPQMADQVQALLASMPANGAPQQGTVEGEVPEVGEGMIPGGQGQGGSPVVDMRPMPEKRPPRRAGGA